MDLARAGGRFAPTPPAPRGGSTGLAGRKDDCLRANPPGVASGHDLDSGDALARALGWHTPRRIEETRFGFGPSVWSPDSRYFLAGDEGGLHLVDRTTNQATLLAATAPSSSSAIEDASFSPDSDAIAYDRIDQTGSDIFMLSLGGSAPVQLTHDHQSYSPLWGPARIAYLRGRGFVDGDIWLMDGDGSQNARLTSTAAGFYPGRLVGRRPRPARREPGDA